MKRIMSIAVIGLGVTSPALAGNVTFEAPVETPIAAPAPIPAPLPDWGGAYIGGQLGYGQSELPLDTGEVDGDGIIGGIHAGYLWDFGTLVAGVEGNYDLAAIEFDDDSGEIDDVARLKLRVGADLGDALLYATAGAAYASASVGGADLSDDGIFGGIGLDYRITDAVTVGAELLRHDFSDFDGSGLDVEVDTLQARASLHF